MDTHNESPFNDALCEVLEIIIHNILYTRNVYPKTSFEKKQKNNVPMWKSLHPGICCYTQHCILVVKTLLEKMKVLEIGLTIKDPSGQCLEEFVFQIYVLASHIKRDLSTIFNIEEILSNFCLSINGSSVLQDHDCKGNSFAVNIYFDQNTYDKSDLSGVIKAEHFPWIVGTNQRHDMYQKIVPVNMVENPNYKMQMYVYHK